MPRKIKLSKDPAKLAALIREACSNEYIEELDRYMTTEHITSMDAYDGDVRIESDIRKIKISKNPSKLVAKIREACSDRYFVELSGYIFAMGCGELHQDIPIPFSTSKSR